MTHVSARACHLDPSTLAHLEKSRCLQKNVCQIPAQNAPNQLYGSSARVNALHACVLGRVVGLRVELGQPEPCKALALRSGH